MKYSKELIEKTVKDKGYKWFEDISNKGYDVNIVGIRNSETGDKVTNLFDDTITISYKVGGVAFMVPGQYRRSHAIGLHQGKYRALRQVGNIKLYRDGDRDLVFDKDTITECSNCGINIHKAGTVSTFVENWSEGCQVFKRSKDFDEFMKICTKAQKIFGNTFTYTLLESKDL
jgi:hypothetical protein